MWFLNTISAFIVITIIVSANGKLLQIRNNLQETIWIGIQNIGGKKLPFNGGFVLGPLKKVCFRPEAHWSGKVWARTGCNPETGRCETGDCGKLECGGKWGQPPYTAAEITTDAYGLDYYDITMVDGFNVAAVIEPLFVKDSGKKYCIPAGCNINLNDDCPNELRLFGTGGTVACKSSCIDFETDDYCCRNNHSTARSCNSEVWPHNYPKFFKDLCPNAYSFGFDDGSSLFTCNARKALVYRITFG